MAATESYEPSFDDRQDFEDAQRGFISALTPGIIKNAEGRVVWDIDAYNFMQDEPCPTSAHPHLWRQGQLNSKQGLFEIVPGIYQVRALDLSNMTIVEGDKGLIIIDPLISCECAAAGLGLYRAHRGDSRPVTGLIYSHSHGDHYMGAGGVIDSLANGADAGIPIIAPEGFIEAVMSESIIAGPAMRKRGAFMYGNALPRGPTGQIGTGLGMASSVGTTSLIPPNLLIQKTGEEHVIDGVRIVFQMVPGTEAPAEINFHFPDFRALCIPETATNCMHNIVSEALASSLLAVISFHKLTVGVDRSRFAVLKCEMRRPGLAIWMRLLYSSELHRTSCLAAIIGRRGVRPSSSTGLKSNGTCMDTCTIKLFV